MSGRVCSALTLMSGFDTTHWSIVRAAGSDSAGRARDALAQLCGTYWEPLSATPHICPVFDVGEQDGSNYLPWMIVGSMMDATMKRRPDAQ